MARPKSDNVQINISIPTEWKAELENLARIYSVEEGKTLTAPTGLPVGVVILWARRRDFEIVGKSGDRRKKTCFICEIKNTY